MGEVTYEFQPAAPDTHVTRFEWKIDPRGDAKKLENGEVLNSNEFTLNKSEMKVGLQLSYNISGGFFSIQLIFKTHRSFELQDLHCTFWIVKTDRERIDFHPERKEILEDQPMFVFKSNYKSNSELYYDVFYYRVSSIGCEIKQAKNTQGLPSKFRESLWKAYKNGLRDACIIKVEDGEFQVSKTILTAQSEVFERMFSINNTEESKTGIVNIQGVSANVMEAVIQFLHLGIVENLDEMAEKLFIAADKYVILDLKTQCVNSIGASLNKGNFFDCIVLAFKYRNDELKDHILNYISKDNEGIFFSLLASGEWLQFGARNEEMAKEIIETVGKNFQYTG